MIEERVARLESDVQNIRETTAEIKSDLKDFRSETTANFADLRSETTAKFDETRNRTDARFDEARDRTDARFDEARRQTDANFADVRKIEFSHFRWTLGIILALALAFGGALWTINGQIADISESVAVIAGEIAK